METKTIQRPENKAEWWEDDQQENVLIGEKLMNTVSVIGRAERDQ